PVNLTKLKTALQSAIAEALQQLTQEGVKEETARKPRKGAAADAGQIQIWEDEPFLKAVGLADPVPAEPIQTDVPENQQPLLKTQIVDPRPDPAIYDTSTPEFRYWNAESALARGINFWGPRLPDQTHWSTDQQPMKVALDAGVDFNAFFSRDSG